MLNVPNDYNELEILMMYGNYRSTAIISKPSFQGISGKKLMYSFRYYDSSFHTLEFVFSVTSNGIYVVQVTYDDSNKDGWLCDLYYR